MSNLKGFLTPKKVENVKVAISKRFVDENGKPLEWELRALTSKEDDALKNECMIEVPVTGKYGQTKKELNVTKYINRLITKSLVTPCLDEIDIQDAYGVKCAEDVLDAMKLTPGEYSDLTVAVQKINGFDDTFENKVKQAKN